MKVIHIITLGILGHISLVAIYFRRTNYNKQNNTCPGVYPPLNVDSYSFTSPLPNDDSSTHRSLLQGEVPIEAVLIIAAVPLDWQHVYALWTHLECVTNGIDKVLISAPDTDWSKKIIEAVITQFKQIAGSSLSFELDVAYYTNDRYDVGLWCDGLSLYYGFDGKQFTGEHSNNINGSRAIFLINDSSVSLRQYDDIIERTTQAARLEQILQQKQQQQQHNQTSTTTENIKLISLNGYWWGDQHRMTWVESVYRGLTPSGIPTFYKQSCERQYLCSKGMEGNGKKRCIVDTFEKDLSNWFKPEEVVAMYPSFVPAIWDVTYWSNIPGNGLFPPTQSWILGKRYAHYLRDELGFPLRKVKAEQHVVGVCRRMLDSNDAWMGMLQFPSAQTRQEFENAMKESAAKIPWHK